MTSCSVDETKDKVIIHYLDGSTYTYKDCSVDCCVEWWTKILTLIKHPDIAGCVIEKVYLTYDTLYIESRHSDSVTIWKNPKYKLSVKTDVMTAKQRAKKNQKAKVLNYITGANAGWDACQRSLEPYISKLEKLIKRGSYK